VKRQLRVALYYGEADAQELAKQLRQKLPTTALLKLLKGRQDAHITQALAGTRGGGLRIVHEQAPTEELAAPMIATAMRAVGPALSELLVTSALDTLKRELETRRDGFVADFERAAQADEDGVTIVLTYDAPPLLEQLKRVLKPNGTSAALPALTRAGIGAGSVEIRAGFARS